MAEFHDLRDQLGRIRTDRAQAKADQTQAGDRLRRIAARETELERSFNRENQAHQAERDRLRAEREQAERTLNSARDKFTRAAGLESQVFTDFSRFTDPRETISTFSDGTPILLMPVRLETRFKTAVRGESRTSQLWVRIYPDDCWMDSFDPTLTQSEVADARAYWIEIWKAGGVPDQKRGAWNVLATGHGSGRARWIVSQTAPANAAGQPTKPRAEDVILTIATDTPLAPLEVDPVSKFWLESWRADNDVQILSQLQSELEELLGEDRASQIIEKYQPVNFADPLPAEVKKDQLNVSVSFLIFAPVETKQSSWSHPPQVKILPDRFAFLGYQSGKMTAFALGNPVPSPLIAGPDPSLPEEEQLRIDDNGNVIVPEEIRWLTDFDRAVEQGMGFRIDLDASQARDGFDRVLVIGLRLNATPEVGKAELETLFRNHSFTSTGLEIVKQGTPTNNTEAANSGHGRLDNPDAAFDDLQAPLFNPDPDWLDKRDGQWLAEYLGIDLSVFEHVHNAGSTDQAASRAMNVALWPATLGYWMESMMAGVFTPDGIEQTKNYFNRFVIGAGAIPAIRIGSQPYGILPATAISQIRWLDAPQINRGLNVGPFSQDPLLSYLRRLYPILRAIDEDWRGMSANVSFVGKAGDPHRVLLDIVGLHPGSVEWSQRYAESLRSVFNRLNLLGLGGFFQALLLASQRQAARGLIQRLGAPDDLEPLILEKIFSGRHNELRGGVVDDKPLSETAGIREYTDNHQNYIEWLIEAANTSLDALYNQNGFKDDRPPTAVLYLLLRHALQLGYDDVNIRLRERAGLLTTEAAMNARIDQPFLHISQSAQVSQSRYHGLYEAVPALTGSSTQPMHQFIAAQLPSFTFTFYLREQLAALNRLKFETTARLERVFADHVDCCSYRLDAWLLGIVNYQLSLMRNIHDGRNSEARTGIYLGAYAWLEDLKPETKVLTPVRLNDPELVADFISNNEAPLLRDSSNQGYIHGPSLNHSTAAAILRNGFISNASRNNRETMAVNLTSERVRTALALLEGIRAGQGLADLLGYQFERGLHDRHNFAEVDKFILDLRRKFPLRADRMNSTKPPEGVSIESIEARNVIDGLALVEQIKNTGTRTYPFGKQGLPDDLTQLEQDAINAEAERLLESHDAVADLALSEGVFQAVMGNYDRVASTYDAYARGNFPPEPDIVRTPLNGIGITHRVALHLEAGADPTAPPNGFDPTPRSTAEPAVNNFLDSVLPALDQVGCLVTFTRAADRVEATREVTLRDLELQPADFVAIIQEGNEQAMSELDDRVVRHVFKTFGPRPDRPITISYMEKDIAAFSVFQLMPLVRNLRQLVTKSRPLKATDLSLANEAESTQDSQPFVDINRLTLVRDQMGLLKTDLETFKTQLEGPLSDLATRKNEILTNVDLYVDQVADLMARAATFVVAQAGWGFAYDFKSRVFAAILKQFSDLVSRWDDKVDEFNNLLVEEAALPIEAIEDKTALLLQAHRAIAPAIPTPPPDPATLRLDLTNNKLPLFIAKRTQLFNLRDTNLERVSDLLAFANTTLLPISDFDFIDFSLVAHEDEMVRFAEDALALTRVVVNELDQRITTAESLITQHGAAPDATTAVRLSEEAARTLLGPDFRIFPEFSLAPAQGDEVENALNASQSGDLFDYLQNPPDPNMLPEDFPVDTWLYGVARVREKMHAWEQMVMFAGSLNQSEPRLDAMQLPFIPGDRWLGLEFPPEQKLDTDRLLYTAHFAVAFNKAVRQCGMLLDEWAETIPTPEVDTGIAFHHDRPNCEAPQTMLLVTPSQFRGEWQWEDLVNALHETLDFAKRRAVEPSMIDQTPYAPFLPATIMAAQISQLTISANLALNNRVGRVL